MAFTVEDVEQYKEGLTDNGQRRWAKIANLARGICVKSGGDSEECNAKAIRMANRFTKKSGKRVKANRIPKKSGKKVEMKRTKKSGKKVEVKHAVDS